MPRSVKTRKKSRTKAGRTEKIVNKKRKKKSTMIQKKGGRDQGWSCAKIGLYKCKGCTPTRKDLPNVKVPKREKKTKQNCQNRKLGRLTCVQIRLGP